MPYQHPSSIRLYQNPSNHPPEGSSTTLLLDHLLYLQANSRLALGRRELGMGPPCPFAQGEWAAAEGESEDEEFLEDVLGYGRGRGEKKKASRVKSRRQEGGGGGGGRDDSGEDEEEIKKVEGHERVLAALLGKMKLKDEQSDEEEDEEEEEEGGEAELAKSSTSADIDMNDQPSSIPAGQSSSSPSSSSPPSSASSPSTVTSEIFTPPLLPTSTQLRLLISGGLDLLLSPNLSPPPAHLPPPSAYNPTLPPSLLKVNSILSPISSSPIPQLTSSPSESSAQPGSAQSVASVHPLLNHSRGPGEAPKPPRGSIWDQVPRAAGPEGPWAFAGGQSQASRQLGSSSSAGPSVATMPSFPSSSNIEVEGPRTKKAVGRAKVLFDVGIQSETPTSFHQPRSRRPPLSTSSSSSSIPGIASGLEPPSRKWWDVLESSVGAGSGEGVGRMMGFLKHFLDISRVVTEGVGKGMVDRVENRRGRSLSRQMFGGLGGSDVGVWTSDSEGSVCGSDDEHDEPKNATASSSSNTIGSSSSSIPTSSATFSSSSSHHHHPLPVRNASYLYPSSQPPSRSPSPTPVPTPSRRGPNSRLTTRQHLARPSRAWYALLSALLTQVCIEGFGEFGWKGGEAVELVLGVGRGGVRRKGGRGGLPAGVGGLEDAGWELFGGRGDGGKRRREFEKEMEERCEEFLTVDSHTRTLKDHFAILAAKYPLQPVERAALRFLESVVSFVGVPELAQPLPLPPPSYASSSTSSSIPISSLLNPHPTNANASSSSSHHHIPFPTYQQQPPTPPSNPRAILRRKGVEKFFVPPRIGLKKDKGGKKVERGVKRGRAEDGSAGLEEGGGKERRLGDGEDEEMEEGEEGARGVVVFDWPDPYGVQASRR